MTGKRYSAGAIFLQVVPVFANVQRAIQDEAKEWDRTLGDSMEKSGEKAGERAGKAASKKMTEELKKGNDDYAGHFETQIKNAVRSAEKELKRLDFSTASDGLLADLREAKAILKGLKDQDFSVDFDAKKVMAKMAALQGLVDGLTRGEHEINIDSNIRKVQAEIKAALTFMDREIEKQREIKIDADVKGAERSMSLFEKRFKKSVESMGKSLDGNLNQRLAVLKNRLDALGDVRIGIDMDASEVMAELAKIEAEVRAVASEDIDIEAKIATAAFMAEAAKLRRDVEAIDGKDIRVRAHVDTRAATRSLRDLVNGGDDASNSFRSFNAVLLAAAGAGPALIPILGAIAGGLLAIGPAAAVAGAGLGSVLIGFSGLGPALQALGNQQDQAARTSQSAANTQRSAAYAIRDAEEALADARRNAARAAEDAADRVRDARQSAAEAVKNALEAQKDAQEAYRESVLEVKDAEEALRQARRDAADNGQSINTAIRENQLAIDQAMLNAFNATVDYNALQADGSATNAEQEQARINMEEAQMRLEELRKEARELAKEKRKWDREGVEGTEEVQSAQDDLNDALEAQRDALDRVRDAEEAVAKARRDGAAAVREALEAQRETAADNARSIADAQEAVRRANEGYAQSMEQIDAQAAAVTAAMDKLGPAGQRFVRFLFGMREGFYRLRDDIQSVMLPAVQQAIQGFLSSDNAGTGRNILIDMAEGFGKFTKALSTSLQGPAWGAFFDMLDRLGPKIMKQYGDGFISFMEAMASILAAAGPLALDFARGFSGMMDAFAGWARGKEGQEAIADLIGYFERVGPEVLDFLGAFASAAGNLAVALAPWGELVLNTLTNFFNLIAEMDPEQLGAIASGILGLVTASQFAYLAINFINAGAALFASTIGAAIFVILAIVAAIGVLYSRNEEFRDFVNEAWAEISDAFKEAWEVVEPSLKDLGAAFMDLWDVMQPIFGFIARALVQWYAWYIPKAVHIWKWLFTAIAWYIENIMVPGWKLVAVVLKWLWEKVFRPVVNYIKDHWDEMVWAMKLAWERRLKPTWNAIRTAAVWLWKNVLKPTFESIADQWSDMMDAMEWAWDHILKPVFDYVVTEALPTLKTAFKEAVEAIQRTWNGLKKVVGSPIYFVLETILNDGLIAGFNKIANFVNMDGIDRIPGTESIPHYATGGILPGYTPGRDVHSFYSPTGGRLMLSGGEAIMRPEWTAAMGPDYINQMNALARQGGVEAIRRASAFATGGIWWPVPGHQTGTYPGHDGVDINRGSGWDDYGDPIVAVADGVVTYQGWGKGYGHSIWINHPQLGRTSLYGHTSAVYVNAGDAVRGGGLIGRVGNTGNSSAPHLHFGIYPGGTYESAVAFLNGSSDWSGEIKKAGTGKHYPEWIVDVAKDPLGYVKDLISGPVDRLKDRFDSPMTDILARIPAMAVGAVRDKVWDVLPNGVKQVAHGAKSVVEHAGDVAGAGAGALDAVFKDGGILPYNGTMKYDSGGYLPPGLTSVVNLTGKPEPVFTSDQWADMSASGDGGGTIHYEPHFEGSNLTAEDVAGDMNFAFRRLRRGGKYAGVGR